MLLMTYMIEITEAINLTKPWTGIVHLEHTRALFVNIVFLTYDFDCAGTWMPEPPHRPSNRRPSTTATIIWPTWTTTTITIIRTTTRRWWPTTTTAPRPTETNPPLRITRRRPNGGSAPLVAATAPSTTNNYNNNNNDDDEDDDDNRHDFYRVRLPLQRGVAVAGQWRPEHVDVRIRAMNIIYNVYKVWCIMFHNKRRGTRFSPNTALNPVSGLTDLSTWLYIELSRTRRSPFESVKRKSLVAKTLSHCYTYSCVGNTRSDVILFIVV